MPRNVVPMGEAVQKIVQSLIDRQPQDISDEELRRRLTAEVSVLKPSSLKDELLRVISQLYFEPPK